jgi:hypothetical protein
MAKIYSKNVGMRNYLANIKIKIDYKMSKCYREEKKEDLQLAYEQMALKKAKEVNWPLYVYVNRKIRFYQKKKLFEQRLLKLDGRKRIES